MTGWRVVALLAALAASAQPAADRNGDGKLDAIVGAEDGFFYFFDRNFIDRSGERPPSPTSGGKAGRLCNLETATRGFLEGASE